MTISKGCAFSPKLKNTSINILLPYQNDDHILSEDCIGHLTINRLKPQI